MGSSLKRVIKDIDSRFGRLVIPTLSDVIKNRKSFFILSLLCQIIFLAILPTSITGKQYSTTLACAFIIPFSYGGGFGLTPAFLADQFGSKNVGATHGVILTAWAIGGVCGGLSSWLSIPPRRNVSPPLGREVEGEKVRFRAPDGRLMKVINGKFVTISEEEEDANWEKYCQQFTVANRDEHTVA
ncbi:hypothetical protein HDV00_000750 [Rhizophlyctis rosea]|nr:hypothetical protein HDV00_000750 [Rhizophlyctis rosea]